MIRDGFRPINWLSWQGRFYGHRKRKHYQTNICDTRNYLNGDIKHVWNMEQWP